MEHIEFIFDLLLFPLFFLYRLAVGVGANGVYKKGYRYHLAPLATVTVTINAGPLHVDNPSVCMESLATSKSSGLVSACFNADGVFTGGTGCQQVLKLRNLSDTPITRSDITVDYSRFSGILDNSCGIDGVDKTGSDCNVSSSPDEIVYNPLGSFDAYKAHSVFVGVTAAGSSTSPFDGPITINYDQNGTSYTGTLKKCQVATEPAKDLCYDSIDQLKEGFGICMDFGFMSFGVATGGCGKQINLRNSSDDTIIDPVVSVITTSFFSGSMMDECGIDGAAGNCTQNDVFNGPFMGMSSLMWPRSITYDPMPDFDSNDTHSVYSLSTINMSVFPDTELIGQYIKDGKLYRGEIKSCGSDDNGSTDANGSMDAVDQFVSSTYEQGKGLKTKVAGDSITVDVVYLGDDMVTPKANEAADIPVYLYLLEDDCSNPVRLKDNDGKWLMATIETNQVSGTSPEFTLSNVARAKRFGMKYIDYDKLVREGGPECLKHSSTGANAVPGMPQCVASDTQYKAAFGEEAYQRCKVGNGQPCKPNNHGVGDAPYDHRYGCYECTLGDTPAVCSSDNFAIRPAAFQVFGTNQYLRAGEEFNMTIKAVDEGNASISEGNESIVKGAMGYYVPLSDLNINSKFYQPTSEELNKMQTDTGKSDVASCPYAGEFTIVNAGASFKNGEVNATLKFSETGILDINVSEKAGHEWAIIDQDDTSDSLRYITPATVIRDKDDISATDLMLFVPYRIETNTSYLATNGKEWLYMNDINASNNTLTTPKIAAYIKYHIVAKNKDGNITRNFTKTCFPDVNEANCPRRNGLKLNTTFDLFLDMDMNASAECNISLYTEDNASSAIWEPNTNYNLSGGEIKKVQEWISPFQFEDGEGEALVYFNIDRVINIPRNPIMIVVSDTNTSTSWMSNPGSPKEFVSLAEDANKTFYYGRVRPSRFFYDDVDSNSTKTPISVVVYSEDPTIMPSPQFKMTNEYDWYLNTDHQSSTDGSVNLVPTDSNGTVTTNPSITDGKYEDVTVTANAATRPLIVDINLTGTDPWLIYNPDANEEPAPFYRVRFIRVSGWAGHGKIGNVVESNASKKKLRRLEW